MDKKQVGRSLGQSIKSLIHRVNLTSGLGPLTARSVVALLLTLYLLMGPISGSADIISASLTYSFFMVLGCVVVVGVAHGLMLKNGLSATVVPPEALASSHESARVFLSLHGARILPFFFLDITLEFEHEGASPSLVRVSGLSPKDRRVHIDLTFPHRGSWDIRGVHCALRDVMGLTKYLWRVPQQTGVSVAPPAAHDSHLPVLSSTQRPGEMMVDIFNRQGEPFDIKSYHPSDGVKKIVWKAFAKRGELLSRHPEASMTPEGFVVMLVIAGVEGDPACAQAFAYSESLARLNLEIIASCEGALTRPPARAPEALKELLIDSVWDARPEDPSQLQRDAAALLDYCAQLSPGITVKKLLLFASAERVANEASSATIQGLATWLSNQGVEPVFCLTPPSRLTPPITRSKFPRVANILIAPEKPSAPEVSAIAYNNFLSSCLHRQWEVHV